MKVIILCGGKGTRLREETVIRPKPLVKVGPYPILWHIMKIYAYYGFKDFILSLGYKGEMIKEYFLNYEAMNNDFTVKLGKLNNLEFHSSHAEADWTVTLADTGEEAQTGARIKKVEKYIEGNIFMVTYGDGVANIDIKKLLEFHRSHGKIGTISGVHPPSRFGELGIEGNCVKTFHEKPQVMEGLINGGYFVFNREFLKYLPDDEGCILENEPLTNLTKDGELMVMPHQGFWQCVDTNRELEQLNRYWYSGKSPWKVW